MGGDLETFEAQRPRLKRLAYRMLGSVAEAEDVLQDAWIRWTKAEDVNDPAGWLVRATSRLCIDRLRSAKAQREAYRGPWLPEPLHDVSDFTGSPAVATELADDLSVGLLYALERLTPLERASFLLHDVFDVGYGEIAKTLERSEDSCRQLAARARSHVKASRPRFKETPADERRYLEAFVIASQKGDMAALEAMLAEDVKLYSDGGGKRTAALNPVHGRDKIIRFASGRRAKEFVPQSLERVRINGQPGFVLRQIDGPETMAFEIANGVITAIYDVRNPDKLSHLNRA